MYSNKKIVNQLTSLLVAKGVKKAVICPGSRNIPLIGNFAATGDIECFSVVDERSAAFYALGMSLALNAPVAVCVTSGSAFLNTLPAIAEARYRQVPLVLISADRPSEWIDRNDGQTMPQYGPAYRMFKAEADICDSEDADNCIYSSLLMNNVLNAALAGACGPVHINVHLHEPLFCFDNMELPAPASIEYVSAQYSLSERAQSVIADFVEAEKKLIVIGQLPHQNAELDSVICELRKHYIVICEQLSTSAASPVDRVIPVFCRLNDDLNGIDMALSLGNTLVSKNIKKFLRGSRVGSLWEINEEGHIHDTFNCQTGILQCSPLMFLKELLKYTVEGNCCTSCRTDDKFKALWDKSVECVEGSIEEYTPDYSQLLAVRNLELALDDMEYDYEVHYANSMEVRIGCLYASHYIWCNRGVNGIEGSVSTAAGYSVASGSMVFCVTGDLSFFYDQNALWNNNLGGNLRIMVLNNGKGGIFSQLRGLDVPEDTMRFINGSHNATARGICEQNDVGYISANNEEELRIALVHFLTEQTKRPMVLEVFTSSEDDKKAFETLNNLIKNKS